MKLFNFLFFIVQISILTYFDDKIDHTVYLPLNLDSIPTLENPSSYCFFNTLIQALNNIHIIKKYFRRKFRNEALNELKNIFNQLNISKCHNLLDSYNRILKKILPDVLNDVKYKNKGYDTEMLYKYIVLEGMYYNDFRDIFYIKVDNKEHIPFLELDTKYTLQDFNVDYNDTKNYKDINIQELNKHPKEYIFNEEDIILQYYDIYNYYNKTLITTNNYILPKVLYIEVIPLRIHEYLLPIKVIIKHYIFNKYKIRAIIAWVNITKNRGHVVSYVIKNNKWYIMNDKKVTLVNTLDSVITPTGLIYEKIE
ncbi:UBP5, Ubiquitin C-terminal hydrolase [Spraguea lophii 42_110]|uniref:UBP5, Ubiquitin C-terminal hydrolase n=1 Tax=Spraguea lophii (strain 42_110) TaxID=1358809 RepID=S7W5U6_SPRLO|nr:UBP5, Ubiquitin C-terminal hydrolase [Spraguea lophii 42_110]